MMLDKDFSKSKPCIPNIYIGKTKIGKLKKSLRDFYCDDSRAKRFTDKNLNEI